MTKPTKSTAIRVRPKREQRKPATVVRGRPFSDGHDDRRNRKGRKAKPKRSPSEEMIASMMATVHVTQGGRRIKKPKIAVVLEQQLQSAMQGDQGAARTLATLVRAIDGLMKTPKDATDTAPTSAHDTEKLAAIMKDYDARLTKSVRKQKGEA